MAPRKSVKWLLDCVLEVFIEHLTKAIEKNAQGISLFNNIEINFNKFRKSSKGIREELNAYLNTNLRSELFNRLVKNYNLPLEIRLGALLLLYDSKATSLSFGHFPPMCYPALAHFLSSSQHSLSSLDCRWVWLKGESRSLLTNALPNMALLKQLIIPHIGDDKLCAAVGSSCHNLQLLDISGATEVTSEGIERLYKVYVGGEIWQAELIKSLQFLMIGGPGGTQLDPDVVAQLLLHLPELVSLGSYPRTAQALLQSKTKRGGDRCKLKFKLKYIHETESASMAIPSLASLCPDLANLFLASPPPGTLPQLNQVTRLHRLKVSKLAATDLSAGLVVAGKRIRQLEIINCKGNFDLANVSKSCPSLEVLQIYYSERVTMFSPLHLTRLTKLVIYSTDISGDAANYILEHCPRLESLTLSQAPNLNHAQLTSVLAKNPNKDLSELAIMSAPLLGLNSVELLIQRLPGLTLLGRLDGWNVNLGHLDSLREWVKINNYDVILWYSLPVREEQDADVDLDNLIDDLDLDLGLED